MTAGRQSRMLGWFVWGIGMTLGFIALMISMLALGANNRVLIAIAVGSIIFSAMVAILVGGFFYIKATWSKR